MSKPALKDMGSALKFQFVINMVFTCFKKIPPKFEQVIIIMQNHSANTQSIRNKFAQEVRKGKLRKLKSFDFAILIMQSLYRVILTKSLPHFLTVIIWSNKRYCFSLHTYQLF